MNILAIADRRPAQSILKTLSEQNIDLIVTLGDLSVFDVQELSAVTNIPKIGVYGNHCSGNYFDDLGIQNMHLKTWEYQGMTFGGFQGSVRYKDNPEAIMFTQEEAQALLRDFPAVDVMLVHCPPYGINDDPSEFSHTGFIGLREYLDQKHPKHLFHGHTYPTEQTLMTSYQQTQIHYIFQESVVTI